MSASPHAGDRRVTLAQRVRLGDVTPSSRLRLDAVARYLQDIATDDGDDVVLPAGRGWILRRLALDVERLPVLGERLLIETSCTGLGAGARWAERTTTIGDEHGVIDVTGRAIWVYVDLVTGAPTAVPSEFFAVYGESARSNRVSARLTLPKRDETAPLADWTLRRTDIDVFRHVNNANYWAPVEEWLGGHGRGRRIVAATIEFGGGIAPDDRCAVGVTDSGTAATFWFVVGAETRATARVEFAGA